MVCGLFNTVEYPALIQYGTIERLAMPEGNTGYPL
jgi:hypothetical protein